MVKPKVNPKLLVKSIRVKDPTLSKNEISNNVKHSKGDEIVSAKALTDKMTTLIQEIDTHEATSSTLIPLQILEKTSDILAPMNKLQENLELCMAGETTPSQEEVVDNISKQETLSATLIQPTKVTSKLGALRRPFLKPKINKKVLSQHKPKESPVETLVVDLLDNSAISESINDVPQTRQEIINNQDRMSTLCFDILQAEIVIPGLIIKDDGEDPPANQQPIVDDIVQPVQHFASNEIAGDSTENITNEVLYNDNINSVEQTSKKTNTNIIDNDSKVQPRSKFRPIIKPKIYRKLLPKTEHNNNNNVQDDINNCSKLNTMFTKFQEENNVTVCSVNNDSVEMKANDEFLKPEDVLTQTKNNDSTDTQIVDSKVKPIRRILKKPIFNKKLLTKMKEKPTEPLDSKKEFAETPTEAVHVPQAVALDELQLNELEITTSNNSNEATSEQSDSFVKPIINFNAIKTKKDEDGNAFDIITQKDDSEQPLSATVTNPVMSLGRGRIKAVPRLDQRRMSISFHGSASESEDDFHKKYKRIRTESASSASGVPEIKGVNNNNNNEPDIKNEEKFKDVKIVRKCKRSEQARKVAEARRNFIHKFGKGVPDKQKLTMMDLIFYNPSTTPMSQKPIKQRRNSIKSESQPDDPESTENNKENEEAALEEEEEDDNNDIPAPQIKIGLNGEIIIDEQSLVIENVQTRKSREELQKSDIVDGDFDTGYGVYKRARRTKDWTCSETVFFYKVLNTLGTDFTMMSEFFHNRTRRELKMKFKKEEKLNLSLIDKALSQPPQFDITDLRQDLEKQKKLMEIELTTEVIIKKTDESLQTKSKSEKTNNETTKSVNKKKKKKDLYSRLEKGAASLWETTSEEDENPTESHKPRNSKKTSKKKTNNKTKRGRPISLKEVNYEQTTSELPILLKPTRSGRIPKRKQTFDSYMSLVKRTAPKKKSAEFNQLQPGSLVIVSCPTPMGEPSFKVFMVTGNQAQVPVTLTDDVLNNLTKPLQNDDTTSNKESLALVTTTVSNSNLLDSTTNSIEQQCISQPTHILYD